MLKYSLLPLLAVAFFASVGSVAAQALPDGPGREILEKKCSVCHGVDQVTTMGRTAQEWHEIVTSMIDLGAEVSEAEAKVLVEYLATNWPVPGAPAGEKPAEQPAPAPQAVPSAMAPVASHAPTVTIREWDVPTAKSRVHTIRSRRRTVRSGTPARWRTCWDASIRRPDRSRSSRSRRRPRVRTVLPRTRPATSGTPATPRDSSASSTPRPGR